MKSNSQNFREILEIIASKLFDYVNKSQEGKSKVLNQQKPEVIADELQLEKWISEGMEVKNMERFIELYLDNSQHMHHPHYIGHQVATPHLTSSLADLIHGVINNPMAVYEMGPGAATIEKVVINWMLDKLSWFKGKSLHETDDEIIVGGGVLTHGGSMANLTAMLAARARICPEAWTEGNPADLVILAPEISHYSIARAISIMGMGSKNIVPIKVNELEVIDVAELESTIAKTRTNGKRIMAVVANACATSTGLYDPLEDIGRICNKHDIWLHVDGAHGAGIILLDEEKHLMKGIEYADSMIWDAHKMLRTSALCAAVLFRDFRSLKNTFRQKGSYLCFEKEKIGFDFMTRTIECTKAALGTKLFFALAAEGEKGIAAYIRDRYNITRTFHRIISEQDDFECPYYPQSNILCFRYNKNNPDDAFQLQLRNKLIDQGDFYITTSTIKGKRYQRLTVMNPYTSVEHLEMLLDSIRELASAMPE